MKPVLIAHRGNCSGPNPKLENKPSYINDALNKGYNCEIDVHYNKGWWLGHDNPQYKITEDFLFAKGLWLHIKNKEALECIQQIDGLYLFEDDKRNKWLNYFWHQNDDYTLTSKKITWCYPGKPLVQRSICVLPEQASAVYSQKELKNCYGICSDNCERYKDLEND